MRRTMLTTMLLAAVQASAAAQDLEFERKIMKKKKAHLRDAAVLLYWASPDGDVKLTADKAVEECVKKEYLPESWKEDLDKPLSFGRLSYLICTTQKIPGGLTIRIFGYSRRYCYKECVYLKLVPAKGPHTAVRGVDLISIVNRVERRAEEDSEPEEE